MPKSKKVNSRPATQIQSKDNPSQQKFVLLFFGLGPLVLLGWFLFSKGFFEPI